MGTGFLPLYPLMPFVAFQRALAEWLRVFVRTADPHPHIFADRRVQNGITGNSWETVHPSWALSRTVGAVTGTGHDRSAFKFHEILIKEWKASEDITGQEHWKQIQFHFQPLARKAVNG